MKRIAFARIPGASSYYYRGDMPHTDAVPPSADTGFATLKANFDLTDNKGNLLIGESVSRIFECNRSESCYLNPVALREAGWSPERIADAIRERFDLVVFPMANAIRPDYDPGPFTAIVEALRTDFVVLGLGKQQPMPVRADALRPGTERLLRIFEERAKIIGVRGPETAEWLHGIGISRALALGCPSMYVYPENLLGLKPPAPTGPVATAGHIHRKSPRTLSLLRLLRMVEAHYVMQGEIFRLDKRFSRWRNFYNDATGRVDTDVAGGIFREVLGVDPGFAGYWYFQDVSAWRVFCSRFRLFLGDRFHGAVAAMQAGVPALILRDDLRVAELTGFFGIPNVPVGELAHTGLDELVAEHLSLESLARFRETYRQRLDAFLANFAELGIPLCIGQPAANPGPIPADGGEEAGLAERFRSFFRRPG